MFTVVTGTSPRDRAAPENIPVTLGPEEANGLFAARIPASPAGAALSSPPGPEGTHGPAMIRPSAGSGIINRTLSPRFFGLSSQKMQFGIIFFPIPEKSCAVEVIPVVPHQELKTHGDEGAGSLTQARMFTRTAESGDCPGLSPGPVSPSFCTPSRDRSETGLVKKTRSLCPVCNAVVEARIVEEDNRIWLDRSCPADGDFRHLYWSDARLFHRFEEYDTVGTGIANPQNTGVSPDTCPASCGLCNNHHSQTLLANIDLTNRCNLACDFCFANASACGFVYEPGFDEVIGMLRMLRDEKPIPVPAVQFSGGEPTMREDLPAIIRAAKELGFPQVQIASNGVKLAQDLDLACKLRDAGLGTVYLHFDGVTRETNPLLDLSRKALENLNAARIGAVLVPTVIRGCNDHELGDIIRFAVKNIAVVRGVNFQPIAFTGAASEQDLQNSRVTIPDVLGGIEEQMGGILRKSDFYPVPCVLPFSELAEACTGGPQVRFTAHQHCGAATYVFFQGGEIVPVNRMVDVDSFLDAISRMAGTIRKGGALNKYKVLLEGVRDMHGAVLAGEAGNTGEFWKLTGRTLISQNFDAIREFHWNALFIGVMHFMDRYNYDIERVRRCCIHYATPDGKLIPFCTYNSGPVYREQVWRKHAKGPTDRNGTGSAPDSLAVKGSL